MFKLTLLCAALVSTVPALGCRRVVILNFNGARLDRTAIVDKLLITGIDPPKEARELGGLQQTIGYYDVSKSSLTLDVEACGGTIELADQRGQKFDIVDDEVTVYLEPIPSAECRIGTPSLDAGAGGVGGAGGTGVGGASGSGGGAGSGDAGDASTDGSGADGAGGCDDGGHDSKIDAGSCPLPDPGNPDVPVVALNPACTTYCTDMATACPGTYADVSQCQRYCTLAGWPDGGGNSDRNDTIACRDAYSQMAKALGGDPLKCNIAGPSGGPNTECGSTGPCGKFCQAWAGICGGDAQLCRTTCAAAPASAISCRFRWLLAASSDRNYCPLVDLDSTCWLPGC